MNKQTEQPTKKLKTKQTEIINHLLYFRHLQQPQIQQLLNHKHKERIRTWLNDLTDRNYIFRIYEKQIGEKPSEYCLDKESIPYLKANGTSERLLKRVYKEKTNSQAFRERSELLATIYLSLLKLTKKTTAKLNFYTKDDLYNIKYLIHPHPDCYFAITEKSGNVKRYFLDVFDNEDFMFKRFYQYRNYFRKRYWQNHTSKPIPTIIFICPSEKAKLKIYGFIQKKLEDDSLAFYLSTKKEVQEIGICREVLKKVEV